MASTKLLQNLVDLNATHHAAFVWLAGNATDSNLVAHIKGAQSLIKGLDAPTKALIKTLEGQVKKAEAANQPIAPLVAYIAELKNGGMPQAKKITDEARQGTTNGNKGTLPDNVTIGHEFRKHMALYRFAHLTHTNWAICSVNPVTRAVTILCESAAITEALKGKGEGNTDIVPEVKSPSRARQVCAYFHTQYSDTVDRGADSLIQGFIHSKWINCGGVGRDSTAYEYGSYAKLYKGDARAWLNLARNQGTLPAQETLVKRQTESPIAQ